MAFDWSLSIVGILTLITIVSIFIWNGLQYKQMNKQLKIENDQLKIQNEQIKHNYFSEYTKRYQEINLHFPENINEILFSYEDLAPEKRDETMRYMRVYFDLCSEEFFLHKNDYIDEVVWKEWEEGMSFAFNKAAFKIAWEKISKDSDFYTDFKKFVNSKIRIKCKTDIIFHKPAPLGNSLGLIFVNPHNPGRHHTNYLIFLHLT